MNNEGDSISEISGENEAIYLCLITEMELGIDILLCNSLEVLCANLNIARMNAEEHIGTLVFVEISVPPWAFYMASGKIFR